MEIHFVKHKGSLVPFDDKERNKLDELKDGVSYVVKINNSNLRSLKQNRSIHLWCEKIAQTLNKENFFIQDVIKMNTKWDMLKVKEMLFKPVVKSIYAKDSTTKLNKDEFEKIIDTLCLYMSQKGVVLPEFPNRERLDEITNNP